MRDHALKACSATRHRRQPGPRGSLPAWIIEMSIEDQEPWPEDVPIPLDHPLVPKAIAVAISKLIQPGDAIHRVPGGKVVEWWLMNSDGELRDAFWLE
jgi:hypothetical protein